MAENEQQSTHKKKTMKTKSQSKKQKSELSNRNEQLSTPAGNGTDNTKTEPVKPTEPASHALPRVQDRSAKPYVNYKERDANRQWPLARVLDVLRRWMPAQYDLAEIVGEWIWITFPEAPAEPIRAELSQLGFHWNNVRKCWQHPCGKVTERGTQDPREKYGSRFAADSVAA